MENLEGQKDGQGQEAESGDNSATGGGAADATVDNREGQAEGQEDTGADSLERKDLPPELEEVRKNLLRDYHSKTGKLAEERKLLQAKYERDAADAKALREIATEDWFKSAIDAEKKRRSGTVEDTEMSDEEFQQVRDDKRAFADLINKRINSVLEARLGAELSSHRKEIMELRRDREHERLADEHGVTFTKAKSDGALDEYVQKGYSLEDAFAKYMLKNKQRQPDNKDVEREAERLLAAKKNGSVNKDGTMSPRGVRVVQAGNFSDVVDHVWKASQEGQKVKIERKRG